MENFDKNTIWKDTLEVIKISVSGAIFSTWFSQTHIAEIQNTGERFIIQIGCNSSFVKTTIETRYFGLIQDSLSKGLGKPCDLLFTIKQIPPKESRQVNAYPLFKNASDDGEFLESIKKAKLRPGFTFDNFAVSSSNQMAWAAAEAVSREPGTAYNPLFIWGGVGVGKTHLMLAVGNEVIKRQPDTKVLFCTAEDFTNDIVMGIRNKSTDEVRNKYRKLKVLLIDDIQFIAGKDTAQEEFFHTFNAVTLAGGQIILTSDRHPQEISKLEERLRSRFEAGLIVDISQPDFELRCAILQIKIKERGLDMDMQLVQLIASNIESARKIEGFLIRLTSEVRLKGTDINEGLVLSLLGRGDTLSGPVTKATPSDIVGAVSEYFSVGKRQLLGASRSKPIALPRQILMYLLRTQLGLPLEEVGRLVGRDHTTVMHAVNKVTNLVSEDVQTREDLLGIKNKL
ncbi:chromosomal replication initiator protein DnaA [Candidatus Woesebacteria bacterium]|nr:chromosomal replication initiator protein DnaA [Candidatus Woesebacteria bacterium]